MNNYNRSYLKVGHVNDEPETASPHGPTLMAFGPRLWNCPVFAEAARNAPTERTPPVRSDGHVRHYGLERRSTPRLQFRVWQTVLKILFQESRIWVGILLKKPCVRCFLQPNEEGSKWGQPPKWNDMEYGMPHPTAAIHLYVLSCADSTVTVLSSSQMETCNLMPVTSVRNEYLSLNQNSGSVWTYLLFIYLPQWYIVGLPLFTWVNCQNSPWKLRSLWDRYEKNEVLIFYPPSYCGHCGHLILVSSWAQVTDAPSSWQVSPLWFWCLFCAFSQTSPQLGDTISPILIHDKPSHPTLLVG